MLFLLEMLHLLKMCEWECTQKHKGRMHTPGETVVLVLKAVVTWFTTITGMLKVSARYLSREASLERRFCLLGVSCESNSFLTIAAIESMIINLMFFWGITTSKFVSLIKRNVSEFKSCWIKYLQSHKITGVGCFEHKYIGSQVMQIGWFIVVFRVFSFCYLHQPDGCEGGVASLIYLAGEKLFSVSKKATEPCKPSFSVGSVANTASVWQNCDLPTPAGPTI